MKRLSTIVKTCVMSAVMVVGFIAYSPRATGQVNPESDWEGIIDAGSLKLKLILHVIKKDGVLSATLDSPAQGSSGLLIDKLEIVENSVRFLMTSLGASYEGVFSKDGSQIEGEFKQMGQALPLTFKRMAKKETATSVLELRKADAGGHSLNLLIGGEGSPTIIFEGGFGVGIASWSTIQKDIAVFARTVSYDRAGLGQSDSGPKPRSAKQIATELHTALHSVGIEPPYVMVGHSLGGMFVRVFADMYPKAVVGMVLIDPSQETFYDWLKANNLADRRKTTTDQIAKAPEGVQAEWAALDATETQVRLAKVPAGIPVTLLTATEDDTMPAEARKAWIEKHKEWLATVPGSKHIVAEKSPHFIQAQQPALVIEAIRQVLKQAQ